MRKFADMNGRVGRFSSLRISVAADRVAKSVVVAGCLLAVIVCTTFVQESNAEAQKQNTAASQNVTEPKWPREFKGEDGSALIIYAPQIEKWDQFTHVELRFATAFAKKPKESPALGTFVLKADTEVDHATRLVRLENIEMAEIHFPALNSDAVKDLTARIQKSIPKDNILVSLDRMVAAAQRAQNTKEVQVKSDPPKVFVNYKLAVLLLIDGNPVWSPIKESDLKFAVNTNWDLFFQESSGSYYLLNENSWLQAKKLEGPWEPAFQLPPSFSKLPADDPNWNDVRKNIPGKRLKPEELPAVYYSDQPAELIVIQGEPKLETIKGLQLQWVSNTESDLFFYPPERNFYYLVSGRWFRTPGLNGTWEFATPNLPEDFKKIPADHPAAEVRPSVPGTREADEAVILASIPQKAEVQRDKVTAEVKYVGDPQFKPIEGTSMSYAVNTSESVIKVGDLYYLCFQAVWFVSSSPTGPWKVADSIPKEIYTISPSSPVHNVTYVYVYDSTPTTVYIGYTSGYYGAYYSYGCVVYGTGYYYNPYIYYGGYYPAYYAWPATYGAAAWYNPYTGTYGRGAYYYGPYGGAGYGARYNPTTGTYARGGYAYGPYQARGWAEAYNPRTGTYAQTRQGSSIYGNWGSTYVSRGNDWVRTGHANNGEAGAMGYKTSNGSQGFVGYKGDDMYAGKDGNLYKKSDNGWSKYENGNWNASERTKSTNPQARTQSINQDTLNQLNREAATRSAGTQRTQQANSWRSSGGAKPRSYSGSRPSRRR